MSHASIPKCVPSCNPSDSCPCQSHLEECHQDCQVCVRKSLQDCNGKDTCPEGKQCVKDPFTQEPNCMDHCSTEIDNGEVTISYGEEPTISKT